MIGQGEMEMATWNKGRERGGENGTKRERKRGSNADMKNTQLESYVSCVSAVSASVYVFVVCVCVAGVLVCVCAMSWQCVLSCQFCMSDMPTYSTYIAHGNNLKFDYHNQVP